jgi:hypothetical protein
MANFADMGGREAPNMAHAISGAGKSQEAAAQAEAPAKTAKAQAPKQNPQDSVKISSAGQAASAKSQASEKLNKA